MQTESAFGGAIEIANELAAKSEALLSTCSQADSTVISTTIPTTMFVQIILNLTNELNRLQGVINTLQKKLRPQRKLRSASCHKVQISFRPATIARVQSALDWANTPIAGNFFETSTRSKKPANDSAVTLKDLLICLAT